MNEPPNDRGVRPAAGSPGARTVRRSSVTFKARRRGLSPARQARFTEWLGRWGLDETGPVIDWSAEFGMPSLVVLDIGFGHGESISQMARTDAATTIVGLEIHTPGVATLLQEIETHSLTNVRVVHGDALVFLDRVAPSSLAGVRIYFPDPWPKVRQHHRRFVDVEVVKALTDRLMIGGTLHFATDIADYARVMQGAGDADERLTGGEIERPPFRPMTRFEQRGIDEGRHPTDLWFVRQR
ncbi:MAG: tRNA (guanosine(46)-N7)-methyltransferase TrmB [Ilumatobacteraceae bacterium]